MFFILFPVIFLEAYID